jgi:ribosome biogenesis GTPase / thiamine phosphate phosphatase
MPDLKELGFKEELKVSASLETKDYDNIARVIQEHKELYTIQNSAGIFKAEITGNMRFAAESRIDFPTVGDWVLVNMFDGGQAIIHKILPRISVLERKLVGSHAEKQLIASNVDTAFIVQAVDRDFNLNRLERYFVIANSGGVKPVVIINKIDLVSDSELIELTKQIKERLKNPEVFLTSSVSVDGLNAIEAYLQKGMTYCFIGSSGVGKSTIINYLSGEQLLETHEISESTGRGKHTTTHRELVLLRNGSILIDTPGMREIGVTESDSGLSMTFSYITDLAKECKFNNCTHTDEPGCKIVESLEEGRLSSEEIENYKKLERQQEHFLSSVAEKRKKDKQFGKIYKEILREKKKRKY